MARKMECKRCGRDITYRDIYALNGNDYCQKCFYIEDENKNNAIQDDFGGVF